MLIPTCSFFHSAGLELVEKYSDSPPDIVLICCGGGGLCAGVAVALKLSGWKDTRIYGVEPQNGIMFFLLYIFLLNISTTRLLIGLC